MASDLQAWVKREAEFYDSSQNPRRKLDAALAYLDEGIGRRRRREVIRAAMHEATGKRVLEIGSQEWGSCLCAHGYRPAQITCINISEAASRSDALPPLGINSHAISE